MSRRDHRLVIGRDGDCDLRLPHDTVSRRHAVLDFTPDGRYRLRDLGSSNGTWRRTEDGWRRVGDAHLVDGDVLRFGDVELTFGALLQRAADHGAPAPQGGAASSSNGTPSAPDTPALERPRRNPETGEVEESP